MNATEAADLIRELEGDLLVGTDEGTHGYPETVRVYERLDGSRYAIMRFAGSVIGTCPIESPRGRLRTWRVPSPASRRDLIEKLRRVIQAEHDAAERARCRREELERGWDGYRFVGVEEGRRILAKEATP